LVRGAIVDPVYGVGQLSRLAVQGLEATSREAAEYSARMRRPKDELAARWGSPIAQQRAIESQRPYQEPGWLAALAKQHELEFGPESHIAKLSNAESAGNLEAAARFGGGLALPFGKARLGKLGWKTLANLAARGAGYGAIQPAEHGTVGEKTAQAVAGAISAPLVKMVGNKAAGAAKKAATAGGVSLWDLVKMIPLHKWHSPLDVAMGIPRVVGSKTARKLTPRIAAGSAVRTTQGAEEGQDEQN
jgi:hypothetical protein